jgi:hypothetical protein
MQRKHLILSAILLIGLFTGALLVFLFNASVKPLQQFEPYTIDWYHPGAFLSYKGEDVYIDFETDFDSDGELYEQYEFRDLTTKEELFTVYVSDKYVEEPDYEHENLGSMDGLYKDDVDKIGTFLGRNLYRIKLTADDLRGSNDPGFYDVDEETVDNILTIDDKDITLTFDSQSEQLGSIISGIYITKSTLQEGN